MIIAIYGINGVGKDRIAKEIQKEKSNVLIVSQSRLLMYHLGIVKKFISNVELKSGAYKKLEAIEEKRIKILSENLCRKTIVELSASGRIVLYLSHLEIVKFFQGQYVCFPSEPTEWIRKEAARVVLIDANSKDILNWRNRGVRERPSSLAEIILQKKVVMNEWKKLIKDINIPYIVIQNRPQCIEKAAKSLIKFIEEKCP